MTPWKHIIIILVLNCLFSVHPSNVFAQSKRSGKVKASASIKDQDLKPKFKALDVGDQVPAAFWSRIPRKKSSRLVILDFWSTGCTSCMEAFPKMTRLQQQFDDQLQIVLVNPWESEAKIKSRLERLNAIRGKNSDAVVFVPLMLPSVNNDTTILQLFPLTTVPHHVWLDSAGVVLYITYGYNATASHIQKVLRNEPFIMPLKKDNTAAGFDARAGLLRKGHELVQALYYSSLFRYQPAFGGSSSTSIDSAAGTIRKTWINRSVLELYKTAFGPDLRVLLNVKEPRSFLYPNWLEEGDLMDEWKISNLFSYEMALPMTDIKRLNVYMQHDLNKYFGVSKKIEGKVVTKKLKSLILVKSGDVKLSTSGGEKLYDVTRSNVKLANYSFSSLTGILRRSLENMEKAQPFLDETGINPRFSIDIQLKGEISNLLLLRSQLETYGLTIIEAEREVPVLLICELNEE